MARVAPVAPIKALCSQRFEDWKQKFGPLGLTCKELTGDTEIDEFFEIQDAHIIMTTPVSDSKILDSRSLFSHVRTQSSEMLAWLTPQTKQAYKNLKNKCIEIKTV